MLAAAALLVSSCAAGQKAQTAEEKPTLDGTEATIGSMQLRGLAIQAPTAHPYYPKGSDALVTLVLVNTGQSADRLIRVSSPAFTSWSAYDSAAGARQVVDADDPQAAQSSSDPAAQSSSDSAAPTGSAPASGASTGASTSATATPTSQPTPTGSTSVSVPANGRVGFGTPEAKGALLVMKFKTDVYPGNPVRVTFSFADNGSKTIVVPVALTNGPNSSVIPAPAGSSGEG